jgi:hypothetical protein
VVLEHAGAAEANACVIGEAGRNGRWWRLKTCGPIREQSDILAQVVIDREGEEIRLMSPAPSMSRTTRARANRVARGPQGPTG